MKILSTVHTNTVSTSPHLLYIYIMYIHHPGFKHSPKCDMGLLWQTFIFTIKEVVFEFNYAWIHYKTPQLWSQVGEKIICHLKPSTLILSGVKHPQNVPFNQGYKIQEFGIEKTC